MDFMEQIALPVLVASVAAVLMIALACVLGGTPITDLVGLN